MGSEKVDRDPEMKNASGSDNLEKKNTSNVDLVQTTISSSFPYSLGSSDNPGMPLVAVPLKGRIIATRLDQ